MNKKTIIILLFLSHLFTQGMFNKDVMFQITQELCINNEYNPLTIKNDISVLTLTNKFLHDYYAQENIKQNIIRQCALYNNSNDYDTADILGCHQIKEKIEYFVNIAEKSSLSFAPEDLKQTWYLNVTAASQNRIEPCNQSLLYIVLNHGYDTNAYNLKKIKLIIKNSPILSFHYGENQNVLSRIIFMRYYIRMVATFCDKKSSSKKNSLLQDLLKIAQSLLKRGMLLDGHTKRSQHTPLMLATMNLDKSFVRLLLKYGANPYAKTYQQMRDAPEQCAFDMNEGKRRVWLEKIVDEVKLVKSKQFNTI